MQLEETAERPEVLMKTSATAHLKGILRNTEAKERRTCPCVYNKLYQVMRFDYLADFFCPNVAIYVIKFPSCVKQALSIHSIVERKRRFTKQLPITPHQSSRWGKSSASIACAF
jgi:hypothetical protein